MQHKKCKKLDASASCKTLSGDTHDGVILLKIQIKRVNDHQLAVYEKLEQWLNDVIGFKFRNGTPYRSLYRILALNVK